MNIDWNYLWTAFGITGGIATFYFGFEARKFARNKNRYSWQDIDQASRALGIYLKRHFKPDVVICFSGPSAIVANLAMETAAFCAPVIIISTRRRTRKGFDLYEKLDDIEVITSTKWVLSVPKLLFCFSSSKVCIVEDAIITGDSLLLIKALLLKKGFRSDLIKTYAVICTQVAKDADKASDKAYFHTTDTEFYFPWGKGG